MICRCASSPMDCRALSCELMLVHAAPGHAVPHFGVCEIPPYWRPRQLPCLSRSMLSGTFVAWPNTLTDRADSVPTAFDAKRCLCPRQCRTAGRKRDVLEKAGLGEVRGCRVAGKPDRNFHQLALTDQWPESIDVKCIICFRVVSDEVAAAFADGSFVDTMPKFDLPGLVLPAPVVPLVNFELRRDGEDRRPV